MNGTPHESAEQRLDRLINTIWLGSPNATTHDRLVGMFEQSRWARQRQPLISRVTALLRSEGFGGALAGARGAGSGRQMLFAADDVDISLHVRSSPGGAVLDGMVLTAEDAQRPFPLRIECNGTAVKTLETAESGSFQVRQLGAGVYTVIVSIDDVEIIAGPIEVIDS